LIWAIARARSSDHIIASMPPVPRYGLRMGCGRELLRSAETNYADRDAIWSVRPITHLDFSGTSGPGLNGSTLEAGNRLRLTTVSLGRSGCPESGAGVGRALVRDHHGV
jgi:hypothetical protein